MKALGLMLCMAVVYAARPAIAADDTPSDAKSQSTIACEYACQLDLGPCQREAKSPEESQGCQETYNRCVDQCNK